MRTTPIAVALMLLVSVCMVACDASLEAVLSNNERKPMKAITQPLCVVPTCAPDDMACEGCISMCTLSATAATERCGALAWCLAQRCSMR